MTPQSGFARKTVLVVDDSAAVLRLVTAILSKGSYETIETTSAAEAIRIVAREKVDLLISDVAMPDLSGGELVAALKASGAVKRCLLISGDSMEELRETYCSDPLVRFLAKPFGSEELLDEIQALFQS